MFPWLLIKQIYIRSTANATSENAHQTDISSNKTASPPSVTSFPIRQFGKPETQGTYGPTPWTTTSEKPSLGN